MADYETPSERSRITFTGAAISKWPLGSLLQADCTYLIDGFSAVIYSFIGSP
jgi:hypothetical protein